MSPTNSYFLTKQTVTSTFPCHLHLWTLLIFILFPLHCLLLLIWTATLRNYLLLACEPWAGPHTPRIGLGPPSALSRGTNGQSFPPPSLPSIPPSSENLCKIITSSAGSLRGKEGEWPALQQVSYLCLPWEKLNSSLSSGYRKQWFMVQDNLCNNFNALLPGRQSLQ